MKADINLQTKVAALLEDYPELESKLIELSPAFAKLKNPVLRRTIAKVTSLQQAASVAGIVPALLIQELRLAAGLSVLQYSGEEGGVDGTEAMPDWYDASKIGIRFDARPLIEAGKAPMQDILNLSSGLEKGSIMEVVTPFRTIPVIDILRSKGFAVWIRDDNSFFVYR